jgi:ATP-binding cassette subfamily F protein uup
VGLVGRNGSGKSTLARIIAGLEEPDDGEVTRRQGLRVEVLEQEPHFEPGHSAVQAVLGGLREWSEATGEHERVTVAIEAAAAAAPEALDALVIQQAELASRVEDLGGWEKRHEAVSMLGHLGVHDPQARVETMSGGEQRRVALARCLAAAPELLILDEPTNHLDVETIEWLERWLMDRFRGAVVLVTHDRALLDAVVTRTVEIEDGEAYAYRGGWGEYLEAKAIREAHSDRVEANRRNFLRRELEWLRRSPKARTTKSRARVERAEAARDASRPKHVRDADIKLSHVRSGRTILEATDIAVDIAGRRLVDGFTLRLVQGERLGVIGPNGCGKTSLLRVLTREAEPAAGAVIHGKNTRLAFLAQSRTGLDDKESIFDNVAEGRGTVEIGGQELSVRAYLERFLFDSREQQRKVGTLSGGERARVALARTLRQDANVVVLDEPTNDLDVATLAALEDALLSFSGTVLVVTHDRWFLDRVATAVLAFEDGGHVTRYEGGYSDVLAKRPRRGQGASLSESGASSSKSATPPPRAPEVARPLTYAERKELDGLVERVELADARVAELEAVLEEPRFYERPREEQTAHFQALEAAKTDAAGLSDRWAELEERA